jgi:hypothetical protein
MKGLRAEAGHAGNVSRRYPGFPRRAKQAPYPLAIPAIGVLEILTLNPKRDQFILDFPTLAKFFCGNLRHDPIVST